MESLLQKISKKYDLELRLREKVGQGFLSDNYVLTKGTNEYFLKKYRFRDSKRIEEIHRVKKYFSNGRIPVILPILTADSETFFQHEKSFFTLFPFVHDQQIPWNKLGRKAITSYAQMLARIHLLGSKSTIAVNEFYKAWDSKATLKKVNQILKKISQVKTKTDFDIRAEKNLLLKKRLIESNPTTSVELGLSNDHLIHGDYIIPNVFFDKNKNVSYVFDWEKTGYSSRFLELFRSMIQCSLFDPARSKWYLDAYLALYPALRKDLENGINAYRLDQIHSLWIEDEHYMKENLRTDELLESTTIKIDYFANHFEEFKKFLFDELD